MKKLNMLGFGGHAKVVLDIALLNSYSNFSIYDDDLNHPTKENLNFIGSLQDINYLNQDSIISIGNNSIRRLFAQKIKSDFWTTLIHPKAIIGSSVEIGFGTVIMAGAIIQSGAKIGNHCVINTGTVIEHDCIIDDFVHVAPNSSLAGGVKVGVGSLIGIGSSVIPNIEIGSWTSIGAGSVVVKNIQSNVTAFGNPCRINKKNGKH